MHCPNCGTKVTSNQKFCRSCGFNLEKFSQLYEEQSAAIESTDHIPDQSEDIQERRRKVERWRNIVATVFITGLFVAVAGYGAIYQLIIREGNFRVGFFFLLFLLGGIATFLLSVWTQALREATEQPKQKHSKKAPEPLPAAETTSKLELNAHREPVLGVTEDTTRSLEPARMVEENRSGELSH